MYSMYVGEGEALLREAFKKARLAAPSIVFLDEIDAMAGKLISKYGDEVQSARLGNGTVCCAVCGG